MHCHACASHTVGQMAAYHQGRQPQLCHNKPGSHTHHIQWVSYLTQGLYGARGESYHKPVFHIPIIHFSLKVMWDVWIPFSYNSKSIRTSLQTDLSRQGFNFDFGRREGAMAICELWKVTLSHRSLWWLAVLNSLKLIGRKEVGKVNCGHRGHGFKISWSTILDEEGGPSLGDILY